LKTDVSELLALSVVARKLAFLHCPSNHTFSALTLLVGRQDGQPGPKQTRRWSNLHAEDLPWELRP